MTAPVRHPSLWRNRDFNVFWLGQALSVLGGSISLLALPVLVLDATGSVVQMGLITVVAGVGTIATGLFAGYVVDRTDRRRLMIACDLLRALLMGSVPFVWLVAGPRIWLLYVVTALVTVLKTFFDVAYVTAVPNLVPVEHLTAANGRLTAAFAFGTLCGPAAAGFIAAAVGADWALGVDGATFLVSAVSLRWVAFRREGAGASRPSGPEPGKLREMFTEGFRFLWAHPVLRALTVLLTLLTFVTLGATDLLIFRVREELGRSQATVGFVIALSGLGVVGAAFAAAPLRRTFGFGVCWLGSTTLIGGAMAVTGVSRSLPVITAAAAVFMFGLALGAVCSLTLRQEVTPDALLGRVTSAFWTVHGASGPVGAAALTVLAGRHGVPAVSVGAGVFCLLIVGAGLLTPLRGSRIRAAPVQGPAVRGPLGGIRRSSRR